MKPIIMFVDDEPHNLTVFEAAMTSDWTILTYDSPLKALDDLTKVNPWIVVSDQRMPGMAGVNLLEIIRRIHPNAKRVLVTGYSEEDLVVDSVRKAQVHDYIRKPWDVDDLDHRMKKMVEAYQLEDELRKKTSLLEVQNKELLAMTAELQKSKDLEEALRRELEAWAPPYILKALHEQKLKFPIRRDLTMITFDIIESSKLHGMEILGRPIRSHILHAFSEAVIKHGGWRESHSGDSAYAHFGALQILDKPAEAALAVASEFRVFLRNFCLQNNIEVECGIGLHVGKDCLIHVHSIEYTTPTGIVQQKSFDSSSSDVDLVHRIEKMTHMLPGSNVAMTEEFVKALTSLPQGLVDIGTHKFKGQKLPTKIWLKASDRVLDAEINHILAQSLGEAA
jgi:CheY-like chemotaxis protein